jgi:hypothetical protein
MMGLCLLQDERFPHRIFVAEPYMDKASSPDLVDLLEGLIVGPAALEVPRSRLGLAEKVGGLEITLTYILLGSISASHPIHEEFLSINHYSKRSGASFSLVVACTFRCRRWWGCPSGSAMGRPRRAWQGSWRSAVQCAWWRRGDPRASLLWR